MTDRDATLDAFARDDASSDADAETDAGSGDDDAAAAADRPDDPAVATFSWTPAGAPCAACGSSVARRWRAADDWVCADCVDWTRE